MPWKATEPMDLKVQFIAAFNARYLPFAELCRRFGISRKTGYKWSSRYQEDGPKGLHDRSRRPRGNSRAVAEDIVEQLVEARRLHPHWGARTLIQWLERREHPKLPAPSTITDLLKRRGMVKDRPRRAHLRAQGTELSSFDYPNDVWCADYKGQFQMGDRSWCFPLTVTDGFSRFLLLCKGTTAISMAVTKAEFERLFRERGLPLAIRSDNGFPFASVGAAGLSELSIWWIKLGIGLERIVPGRPQQNGRHERFHRTLQQYTADDPAHDLPGQQVLFDRFGLEYNHERPHAALAGRSPAHLYVAASRTFPNRIEPPSYPGHNAVRSVRHDGTIRWHGKEVFVSKALAGEQVGLEEIQNDRWLLRFASIEVAILDGTTKELSAIRLPSPRTMPGVLRANPRSPPPSAPHRPNLQRPTAKT